MRVELITPEAVVLSTEAQSVTLPTTAGEITVMRNHIPLVTTLAPGMMTVRGSNEQFFAVSRGTVQVEPGSIRILSDIADRVDALDEKAVEEARLRAEKLLQDKRGDAEGFAEATAILDRELARLRSVRRRRHSRLSA